jgi:hypothetical protein
MTHVTTSAQPFLAADGRRVWDAYGWGRPASGTRQGGHRPPTRGVFNWLMADLAFVLLSIGVFALLALVVKGVERL